MYYNTFWHFGETELEMQTFVLLLHSLLSTLHIPHYAEWSENAIKRKCYTVFDERKFSSLKLRKLKYCR